MGDGGAAVPIVALTGSVHPEDRALCLAGACMRAALGHRCARAHLMVANTRARSPQTKRLGALNKFKSGARTILLATDVASRGLDIPAVDVVINYDTPSTAKDYVHRCAAAAAAGCARALSRRRPAP